jgi:hypothetical protein
LNNPTAERQTDLATSVAELLAIERIRNLKAKYFRRIDRAFLDDSLKSEIGDVFSTNAVCDYGAYGVLEGREQIVAFFRETLYPKFSRNVHMGHNPEIELTSATTAKGTWVYEAYQLATEPSASGKWICGYYTDEYVIEEDEWKISYTTGTYFFELDMPIRR